MAQQDALTPSSSIEQALAWAKEVLVQGESPVIDARIILCHCLDVTPTYLMTWPEKALGAEAAEMYASPHTKAQLRYPCCTPDRFQRFLDTEAGGFTRHTDPSA